MSNKIHRLFFLILISIITLSSCDSQESKLVSREIVIVNVGVLPRAHIAREIDIINTLNPKVIALDLQFSFSNAFGGDSLLKSSLMRCRNLVIAGTIENYTGEDLNYNTINGSSLEFSKGAKIGYINALFEQDTFKTLKKFSIHENVSGILMYHFAVRTAMAYDSIGTIKYIENKAKIIDVEYKGGEKDFQIYSYEDVIEGKLSRKDIEGKIVLFGFCEVHKEYKGEYDEDIFFTPLNDKKKPYKPDMHGVIYLANIINQILIERW